MLNERRFVAPARFNCISTICEFVLRAAESAGLGERARSHVELAVDEACTNIVEHACGGDCEDKILVNCGTQHVQDEDFFVVRLRDRGRPFDPACIPTPNLTSDMATLQVGGLGMHFMRKMMDRIEFRSCKGWNELVMYKRLGQERS